MSSGNKMKVADQKFIFCQVCFYFRPFSFFQRNMKNKTQISVQSIKEYRCTEIKDSKQ